jgi:peptide/nickel transport system ATP-binding protein
MEQDLIISVENLSIEYGTARGILPAVRGMSFTIKRGETLGLVGESGSGKSSVAFAVLGYLPKNGRILEGTIGFLGHDMRQKALKELRSLWGKNIAMVYQDPMSSLNPSLTVGFQIAEVLRCNQHLNKQMAWRETIDSLERVKISDPESSATKFPHQMSGGQQQRVVIATAICRNPDLLILDEPTTGLDVTTEATILDLVNELKKKFNSAILFISHNLGIIGKISDKIIVLYAGQKIEAGITKDVFRNPLHPYTKALIDCIPTISHDRNEGLQPIPGVFPDLTRLHDGCIFHPRCEYTEERCKRTSVPLIRIENGREVACLRWNEIKQLRVLQEGKGNPKGL